MEQIFTKLAHSSLDKDFKKQLDKYMANVEKKRINDLRSELFKDLPSQTINFLEQLSITHQMLDDLDLEAIQPLAIIYTISLAKGYEQLGHFLRKYGLDSSHFEKYLMMFLMSITAIISLVVTIKIKNVLKLMLKVS